LALGAFAGLRGAELERLQWQNVDFQTGHIRIGGEIAKTRSKRLIPISDNLRDWLLPYAKVGTRILPVELQNTFRDLLHRACKRADVKWKHNGLRHSFGTYSVAHTGDARRTSLDMGNSPAVIFKHYRELVTAGQAAAYWNIRPLTQPKIIQMVAAA
jgi:integrase